MNLRELAIREYEEERKQQIKRQMEEAKSFAEDVEEFIKRSVEFGNISFTVEPIDRFFAKVTLDGGITLTAEYERSAYAPSGIYLHLWEQCEQCGTEYKSTSIYTIKDLGRALVGYEAWKKQHYCKQPEPKKWCPFSNAYECSDDCALNQSGKCSIFQIAKRLDLLLELLEDGNGGKNS